MSERAKAQYWVRRPKDSYKHHPSYLSLIQTYGQAPGGYFKLELWEGLEECMALYRSYMANGKKLPDITVAPSTDLGVEGNPDDSDMGEVKSNDGNVDIDGMISDLDNATEKEGGKGDVLRAHHTDNESKIRRGARKRKQTEKSSAYNGESERKRPRGLSLGIHVRQVSEKGKIPKCQYCRCEIGNRGVWHMIKVTKSTINPQWCKNELHFHFTCARAGLEEKARDVNQLLAIVRSETTIGSEEKQLILTAIGEGEGG